MWHCAKLVGLNGAAVCAIVGVVFSICDIAQSQTDQDESNSRGVRIIDAPTPPAADNPSQALKSPPIDTASPALLTPATSSSSIDTASPALLTPVAPPSLSIDTARPAPLTPATPSPSVAAPSPAPPSASAKMPQPTVGDTRPIPASPPNEVPAPVAPAGVPSTLQPASNNFANVPNKPDIGGHQTQQDLQALSHEMKIPNLAGLSMQILPGLDIVAGSQVSFEISSKKAGYLILVDVDATGKLVQIYPNPMSLMGPSGVREQSNYLRPGKALQIPDRQSRYSGFEFIASPPTGTAMVIALLSDRPVQLVDLPDVPGSLLGNGSAVDYLAKLANELRIPNAAGNNRLDEAHWSFDVKFYAIR